MSEMKSTESRKMEFKISRSIISKIIECVGAVFVILGCFMPIYSIDFLGMSKKILYIEGDGYFTVIIAIVTIILTCMGKQLFSAIPLTCNVVLFGYTIFNLKKASEIIGSMGAAVFIIPFGLILMIVGVVLSVLWKTDIKTKKSTIIAGVILVLSVVLSISSLFVVDMVEKSQSYKEAVRFMKEEKYDDAIEKFKILEDYKDSKDKVLECQYLSAEAEEKDGDFETAIEIYTSLKDYKDSKDKILECQYLSAEAEEKDGDFEEAIEIYTSLKDYKDSKDKILECHYLNAQSYIETENYSEAVKILNKIKGYKDVDKIIDNCNFYELKSNYNYSMDISALIDGINKKCPENKEAEKFVNEQISEKLNGYDKEEYYQGAVEYLKEISDKWNVKKELQLYEGKQKILDKYESIKIDYVFEDEITVEYALIDMDNDGINEIIVSHGTCSADWTNDFYHVNKSGEVVCAGTLDYAVSFYSAENGEGVYAVYGHMDHEIRYHVFFSNDKLKIKVVEEREIGPSEEYYSNDKPIEMESDNYYW